MNLFLVAEQMILLFAMIAIGFILSHLSWIDNHSSDRLSRLVVNVFNPALTIYSVLGQNYQTTGNIFWQNLILVILMYGILFIAGIFFVLIARPSSKESPIYRMIMLLPNCGFMGIPVVSALLGTEYIIYVSIYMLAYNIIIYTYGIHLAKKSSDNKKKETSSLWQKICPIFCNSGVISSLIALIIFFSNITLPNAAVSFFQYMGNPCIPLSMLLIGHSLATSNISSLLKVSHAYLFTLVKMLVVPILCTFLIRIIPFDSTILKLFIIILAMPAGTLSVLIVEQHHGNVTCATNGIILSTLVALITIPIVSLFL